MKVKIVSIVTPETWVKCGKRFAESYGKYWKGKAELQLWHLGFEGQQLPEVEGIKWSDLTQNATWVKLLGKEDVNPQEAVVALALGLSVDKETDWLAYADSSLEFMREPDGKFFELMFPQATDMSMVGNKSFAPTGQWLAFNLHSMSGASLVADYWGLYDSGEAFKYKDSSAPAVMHRLINLHRAHGARIRNLSEKAHGADFVGQSELAPYVMAYAPPNFDVLVPPNAMQPDRYAQVGEVAVHAFKQTGRANFVEVGTWNGSRAVQMALAAFAAGAAHVDYVGFDLFEQMDNDNHEVNVKASFDYVWVQRRLACFAKWAAERGRIFSFRLVQGNTLETLPRETDKLNPSFVFLDGGHSKETVASDYSWLKKAPFIVFDDVYSKPEEGAPTGPHEVWLAAEGQKGLLVSQDKSQACQQPIGLGMLTAAGYLPPQLEIPIKVTPVDSVEFAIQNDYIIENSAKFKEWLQPSQAHGKWALLVSAGPSLKEYGKEIKKRQKAGAVVFAVKHALPELSRVGVIPDYVVVLDPRPLDDVSTHGVKRTDLFSRVDSRYKMLVASMTNPSVVQHLEQRKARLIGWHALTKSAMEAKLEEFKKGLVIGGGTCTATRLQTIAFVMGFRRMAMYGYDFEYPADAEQGKIKQKLMKIRIGKNKQKEVLTTGELIAAMQDLGQWNQWLVQNQITVEWKGDGVGPFIWNESFAGYQPPGEFA